MYSEGEEAYLNDLDWVNIVKSLRELKALSRIILNKYQLQILSFENTSVLPRNKLIKIQESDLIQDKVPLEYASKDNQSDYMNHISKFINQLPPQAEIDLKILAEISSYPTPTSSVKPKLKKSLDFHSIRLRSPIHS